MRNKILLGIVVILTIVLIVVVVSVKETYFEPLPVSEGETPVIIRLLDTSTNTINELNLEDYIVGVVAAEMPASFNLAMYGPGFPAPVVTTCTPSSTITSIISLA